MARERYIDQVRPLVDILPAVAAEEDFALKGGTAINLFYRDLPRLSVDVDLTFLPIGDRAQSLADIDAAMDRIALAGSKARGATATRIAGGGRRRHPRPVSAGRRDREGRNLTGDARCRLPARNQARGACG